MHHDQPIRGFHIYRNNGGAWERKDHRGDLVRKQSAEIRLAAGISGDYALTCPNKATLVFTKTDTSRHRSGFWRFSQGQWVFLGGWKDAGPSTATRLDMCKGAAHEGDIALCRGERPIIGCSANGNEFVFDEEWAALFNNDAFSDVLTLDEEISADLGVDEKYAKVLESADQYKKALEKNAKIFRDFAQMDPKSNGYKNAARAVRTILQEACPGPTPSPTTGIPDYVTQINDIYKGSKDIHNNVQDSSDSSLKAAGLDNDQVWSAVGSTLASAGALCEYAINLQIMLSEKNIAPGTATGLKQKEGVIKTAAGSAMISVPKMVLSALSSAENIATHAAECSKFTQAITTIGGYTGIPGAILGVIVTGRHMRKADRARTRKLTFRRLLKEANDANTAVDLKRCLTFLIGKTNRREGVQYTTAATAATSASATIALTTIALVGGANAWNPVGWTLIGVAAIGGAGVAGYKTYRRVTRKSRHERRAAKGNDAGVIDAVTCAYRLIAIYYDKERRPGDSTLAGNILEEFGVVLDDLSSKAGEDAAAALVKRHLTG